MIRRPPSSSRPPPLSPYTTLCRSSQFARRLAFQDLDDHFAGLQAKIVIVNAQGRNGPALDAVGIGSDKRYLSIVAYLDQSLVGGHYVIVGIGVDDVDLADQAACCGADVDGTRCGGLDPRHRSEERRVGK